MRMGFILWEGGRSTRYFPVFFAVALAPPELLVALAPPAPRTEESATRRSLAVWRFKVMATEFETTAAVAPLEEGFVLPMTHILSEKIKEFFLRYVTGRGLSTVSPQNTAGIKFQIYFRRSARYIAAKVAKKRVSFNKPGSVSRGGSPMPDRRPRASARTSKGLAEGRGNPQRKVCEVPRREKGESEERGMNRIGLVASVSRRESFARLPTLDGLDCRYQWRADLEGPDLPEDFPPGRRPRWLFSLRSRGEGGGFCGSDRQRRELLERAAPSCDLVELEGRRDLDPGLLSRIPPSKRLISWRDAPRHFDELQELCRHLHGVEAAYYQVVSPARRSGEELAPLRLLRSLGRRDTVAYASGKVGLWTRLLSPHFGAPLLFGSLSDGGGEATPSLERLVLDYGFPQVPPLAELSGIVGDPVIYSLFPRVINASFRHFGQPSMYVPFHVESFDSFAGNLLNQDVWSELGIALKALTVVSPFKEAALEHARIKSPMAVTAASCNLLLRTNGFWVADTSDAHGIELALGRVGVELKGKRAAVIGCGGSGRAIAAALAHGGAETMLVNRGLERGRFASAQLGLPLTRLAQFSPENYQILVNATPVGREGDQLPIDFRLLEKAAAVVDLAYGKTPTPLIRHARSNGSAAIDGREVLLGHATSQFKAIGGRAIQQDLARRCLTWDLRSAKAIPAAGPRKRRKQI